MTDLGSASPTKPEQSQSEVVGPEFVVADSVQFEYSGPLPPAAELERYGRVSADFPESRSLPYLCWATATGEAPSRASG